MELEFMAKLPRKKGLRGERPTCVINKLYQSLDRKGQFYQEQFCRNHHNLYGSVWDSFKQTQNPKIHQIQQGLNWDEGMSIHPIVNYNGAEAFQFAPTLLCQKVQDVKLISHSDPANRCLFIDNRELSAHELVEFAINEGFDSLIDFWEFHDTEVVGQLIHWTAKIY